MKFEDASFTVTLLTTDPNWEAQAKQCAAAQTPFILLGFVLPDDSALCESFSRNNGYQHRIHEAKAMAWFWPADSGGADSQAGG